MKALKIVLIVLLVIVLLIGGGIFLLVKNLDGLVARVIESVGTEVLQTEVSLDSVNFELDKGRGELHGLSIANYPGFEQPTLFKLNQIALQIEPSSVNSQVVVIDEILVDGAHLTVEHTGVAKTNIQTLIDTVKRGSTQTSESKNSTQEPRFMVEKLSFTDISMDVISPQLENRTVTLQDIQRENLGTREQGLTGPELVEAVIQPIIDRAKAELEGEVRARATEEALKAIDKNLSEEDKEKLNQYKDLLKQQ
ncbi:DUF748 domain-containing protein [Gilvimarinus algae]|uniref:AsmA domain-containing protein n=1 Tax=Gilvimarinus algae TaxID=3058037 RepID=A0ABT8TFA1_9GAMM|nr:hypothetical protein [Gilvimarinus sp. SDUM040014]MDO3382194.1 hypothetical protein [Gilvimarinus sp. SDUM040014]